jgi:hypothetical protein
MFGRVLGLDGRESYRELRRERLCCPHRPAEKLLHMSERIHGEKTASELQDRVTELVEQQAAISEVLLAIARSPDDLQPSSTPSSTARHVSVEQTWVVGSTPGRAGQRNQRLS